jgi:integrase/recombinase XerD
VKKSILNEGGGCLMSKKINLTNRVSGKLTIGEAFRKFMATRRAMKVTDQTIYFYENCFKYFTEFCPADTLAEDLTKDTVIDYLNFIDETKPHLSDQTIYSYMTGTKPFLKFFIEEGYTGNITFPPMKKSEPLKETYTDDQLAKLLVKPDVTKCSFAEYRDWVIICHILATGNRRGTICNIKNNDVDLTSNEINLRVVKNRKAYIVPISSKYATVLKEYMSYRGGEPDDYLFCTAYQEQMTRYALQNSISKYNKKRGVGRTSVHAFRHTFAKKWIMNGGDIFRLQQMLGHSSLDMVKKYVSVFREDLKKDFDTFSPLDNIEFTYEPRKSLKLRR